MNLEYYIINGRGENGSKFQLAKLQDESGNTFKGKYDMSRHFESIDEMTHYIAEEVIKKPVGEISLQAMNI